MKLVFVRHGDAHAGLTGIIPGPKGCGGLTDLGRQQAALLRDRLASGSVEFTVDRLLSSELPRAIETAAIIGEGLATTEVPRDCDLCELHTGDADGMSWDRYSEQFGGFDMLAEPDRIFAQGGDSWSTFHDRVDRFMRRTVEECRGETVMAVSHAGVIAASIRVRFGAIWPRSAIRRRP